MVQERKVRLVRLMLCAILVMALASLDCSSKKSEKFKQETIKRAEAFLSTLPGSDPSNQAKWGFGRCKIFGRDRIGGLVGKASFKRVDSTRVRVLIPFWCRGTDAAGESRKLRRKINVAMKASAERGGMEVVDWSLGPDLPLTFWKQVLTWLWSSVQVFFMLLAGTIWIGYVLGDKALGCLWALLGLGLVPISGYFAYICFASVWAVAACCLVMAVVGGNVAKWALT